MEQEAKIEKLYRFYNAFLFVFSSSAPFEIHSTLCNDGIDKINHILSEVDSLSGHHVGLIGGGRNEGLLSLLRIHAELGKNAEEISAAALFEVYRALSEKEPKKDAKSVANELLSRYPSSIFAKQLKIDRSK